MIEPDIPAVPPSGSMRYLSVGLGDRRFAIPLDQVIGVVESAPLTPIPFSPEPFGGLVQAMGQVVPQISLAALLGLPPADGGTLVVASDLGGSVALRVEHVYAMLQVDRDKLVLADPRARAEQPMVLGFFGEGTQACAVISMHQLTSGELAETRQPDDGGRLARPPAPATLMDSMTPQPSRLLLLGEEPVLHALPRHRLGQAFAVRGQPGGQAEALALARAEDAHVVLIDADTRTCDPPELVAAALLQAGAHAVLHKPAGRLPLDLDTAFGDHLVATLLQAAGA